MKNKHYMWFWAFCVAILLAANPATVHAAAESFGTLAKGTWTTEAKAIGSVVPIIAALIGATLALIGLVKWAQSKQTHQPAGGALWLVAIGALLCSLSFVLGSTSATVGADASGLEALGM